MKGKISLNQLMHNNKLMMAVSVGLALIIWMAVVYDSHNVETRQRDLKLFLLQCRRYGIKGTTRKELCFRC